ncbi:LPS export ABC transporter periplasmic protein LptC [Flavobacterium sp.]|uniref:LPS export ABC transporter periplasmic protein LptC n=1 Tax=Flavobacterium sp. TaxID=239 RepID=UPI003526FA50
MQKRNTNIFINIVVIFVAAMFFSCEGGSLKDVQKTAQSTFLPTGEADTINLKYTDSGKIVSNLISPKMLDYSNASSPFVEFPTGIKVVMYNEEGAITTTITSNYAISYSKTDIIDLQGNVKIVSSDGKKMETEQLYYDQKNEWFFTEKFFKFTDANGRYLQGPGVDFNKDFTIFNMQKSTGELNTLE